MKIAFVMGTRPEIIKLAPIIKKLNKKSSSVIFTGQHFDYEMSLRFIEQFGLRAPDYKMKLTKLQNTTTDRATQLGEIILGLSKIITSINPDCVVVQGDTNTVLAAAMTSLKCSIPISHVESGLRSYDWRMPEEHNRITVDHISDILFAPTKQNKETLKNEKVHGKIFVTGNTAIDAVEESFKKVKIKKSIDFDETDFALLTLHRGENVDNKKTLISIINGLIESKTKIIFPAHPRTIKRLNEFKLMDKLKGSPNITILPSLGYFDMLYLMKCCKLIISDSGGIQEEVTAPSIRKKVVVVRDSTERIEAVNSGFAEIAGTNSTNIKKLIIKNMNTDFHSKSNPYGTGRASQKIIKILQKIF